MLTIKIQYGEDIRRISLHEDSNLTVSDLYKRIHHMFPSLADVPYEKLYISYRDGEGDDVRITNDLEYAEAVHMLQENAGVKLLRLTIQNKQAAPSPFQPISFQTLPRSQTPPPLSLPRAQTPPPSFFPAQPTTSSPTSLNAPQTPVFPPVNALAGLIPAMMTQMGSTQGVDPIARLVASVLTSAPGATTISPLAVQPELLSGLMHNISQLIPPEQLIPAVTSMMQSPAIQQMIPQIIGSIFNSAQVYSASTSGVSTPQRPATPVSDRPTTPVQTDSPASSVSPSSPADPPIVASSPARAPTPEINRPASADRPSSATSTSTSSPLSSYSFSPFSSSPFSSSPFSSFFSSPSKKRESELKHASNSNTSSPVVIAASSQGGSPQASQSPNVDKFNGSKFGDLLQQLNEIGFTDEEKNIQILAKHSGDLNRVVDDLVSEQQE